MVHRSHKLLLLPIAVFALSGCADVGGSGGSAPADAMVELAVSDTCAEGSSPACVAVNGEYVERPSTFEGVRITDASVVDGGTDNAVAMTLDAGGTAVLQDLTREAAGAGGSARLLVKIGDEIKAAVMVPEAITTDDIQLVLAPNDNAQDVVDLILGE